MGGEQSKGKGDPEPKGGVAGGVAPGQVKNTEPPKSAAALNGELHARVEEEPKSKTDPPIPAEEPVGTPLFAEKVGPDILVQPRGIAPSAETRTDPVVKEEYVTPHVESAVVERILHLYTEEWAPDVATVSLRTKALGDDVRTTVCDIAATVGFPAEFTGSMISLDRPKGSVGTRQVGAAERLAKAQNRLSDNELSQVDEHVEKDVLLLLNEIVDAFPGSGKAKESVDTCSYLLPSDEVQGLLQQVAKVKGVTLSGSTLIGSEKKVDVVAVAEKELVPELAAVAEKEASPSKGVAPAEADGNNDEAKLSPRVIPEGELVWRRLQHWCTNVRKEKKFNIWARNLDDRIKQKIIDIAMEVGFEAATIQPNGNIHVEIKPPADKQNRKRLRRPSPEVVEELIPVDKAVTENAAAHMQEWITEFAKSRKPRDTLNCRFALPADWIRKTATELAEASNLKVVQETGIELIFSRSDLTEEEIEEMLRKAKEEPKPAPLSARSPRDTRMSPRNPVRMSPRNPIRGRHSRGGRSDGRGRGRGRWEFRSRTPPPNLSQYPARRTVPGGMGPPGAGPMSRGPAPGHHAAGMQAPSWQQRPLSFHAPQHYAAPGSNFHHPAFMSGSHSYGGGGSMGGGPFGGPSPYSLQHHHVNRGGSHSSRSYNDGYGPY